jgi:ketosteroid isomerase-like protein
MNFGHSCGHSSLSSNALVEAAMKTNLLVAFLLVFFSGCTKQEPAQMTPEEQETAKKEIREVINLLFQACEKLDLEAGLQPFSHSPDFIFINTKGSMMDFQGFKNVNGEFLKTLSSLKYSTVKDEFRFLPNGTVIYAWQGKCEMTLKTGEHFKIDTCGATQIFSKINNQWKIIYSHKSLLRPVQEKPNK